MNTPFDFPEGAGRLVYVRPVPVAELPEDVQPMARGLDHIYALHGADGERLALVRDRHLAFVLARQNDLAPVNVH
ncbi:DUF1150 family protein [Cereibacter johrii]|uniref:DUF1150 family protein n=1 Tax=Cereibacter johrii TaxID=445629 RepID=A0ABX5J7S1_9RHOB|nr:DUF1150 family protein [Cereibacter johrii]QCP84263.1 DUF1150 domain-containing protein [Cereibacter sphaeroides]RDS95255.1 DUF1150 domain-containing protein [Cereibacter sphaeroides f. sp. denitrificans]ODM41482.1 hypothetical protein A9O63_01135 [Cereibacter johrii]PTM74989.1 hypothetical protein C8J29_11315 [Cereibacter johrii]RAZ81892.1 DUF1150 domain-containing protein [Cereibacter johrii]